MEKEQAKKNAKFLADDYEQQLQEILERNPIENLEEIQNNLLYNGNSQLHLLVQELLKDLKTYDEKIDDPNKWRLFEGSLWREINYFQQVILEHFFFYNLLQVFFVSDYTPLNKDYRETLLKKHKLTPKKLKETLDRFLGNKSFLGKVKHGGKKGFWNDDNKLEFLALYNRFLIVIKNLRRDIKPLIKKGKPELSAKKEVIAKYEIPETLIISAFSPYDAPQEIALDWAKKEKKLNFKEEYLKDILTEARKIWRSRSNGLISQQTLKENPKTQLILIDMNFEIGCRYYAVASNNKIKMENLKYVTVAEKLNGQMEFTTDEDFEEFLVWQTF